MKRHIFILAAIALTLFVTGCKKNPISIITLPEEPKYIGEYMETSDVRRIGHALDTAPTRSTIQWENGDTGFQYSMMVFTTEMVTQTENAVTTKTATRKFTVLSIAPTGNAQVLNLVGRSSQDNVWRIVAEAPASSVGKAVRMDLTATPTPEASLSSGTNFHGFMVAQ